MAPPKFILGDNTNFPEVISVFHTEFSSLIINLDNDVVEWFENFDKEDQKELGAKTETTIKEASDFYNKEVACYQND